MKLLILIVLLLFIVNPRGQSQEIYNLNGTWKFAFAKTKKEALHAETKREGCSVEPVPGDRCNGAIAQERHAQHAAAAEHVRR